MEVADGRRAAKHQKRPSDQKREEQVAERTRGRGEAAPTIVADGALVEVHRAARQPDAADQQEHDRQRDAEHGVRVLEWVQ